MTRTTSQKASVQQSSTGEVFTLGDTVWSRKLSWTETWGSAIREQYGVYRGYIGFPTQLTVRRARRRYRCNDCGRWIEKGELHGSAFYAHYCIDCVTHQEPPRQFKAAWDAEPIVEGVA